MEVFITNSKVLMTGCVKIELSSNGPDRALYKVFFARSSVKFVYNHLYTYIKATYI